MIRHETGAWCGMTLRRTSWQQKPVSETKRSIAHPVLYWQELIPFNQRTCRIIFKMCFSRSCMPSQVTRHILEVLLTHRHTLVTQNCQASVTLHHCILNLNHHSKNEFMPLILLWDMVNLKALQLGWSHPPQYFSIRSWFLVSKCKKEGYFITLF